MKKVQQGFTLIELMIVVAIIGILAAIAIPAYQDYMAKSQAAEASSLLSGLKAPIAEFYTINGTLPDLTTAGELNNAITQGDYVASITADTGTGAYTATYQSTGINQKLKSKTVSMTYNTSTGEFSWSCTSLEANVRPSQCP